MQNLSIPSEKEALNKAAALCSRKECCESEVREKLTLWKQPSEVQDRIIGKLLAEGYIDEVRFCKAYAMDKLRYNHWGRIKINQMLRHLQVDDQAREAALEALTDEEYMDILRRVAQSKLPSIKARTAYERQGKLTRFLLSRGFEMGFIRKVTNWDED